jgi:hypothetical protein
MNTHLPRRRRVALAAVLAMGALALATLPLHAAEGEPLALEAGFKPAEQAAALVSASETGPIKGLKRVAVAQFAVEFVTADSVSAQTSGFGTAGRASVSGQYKLVGVQAADFQALLQDQYSHFIKQLRERGLEVVEPDQLAASATWRKLVAAGTPLPQQSATSITVGPPGHALYGFAKGSAAQAQGGLFGTLTAIGSGFGAVGAGIDNSSVQQELDGAALIEVTMRVHFAQLTNHNKGFFGRLSDRAEVSAKLHPIVTQARLSVQAGPAVTTMALKRPLLLDPEAFTELRKLDKSAGEVAGAVALGLLRMAIGNKDSSSADSFEAVSEPVRYRERVGAGLATVGELFVNRIAAER